MAERMGQRTPPEDEDLQTQTQTQTSTSTFTYISSQHPPLIRDPSSVEDDDNDDGLKAVSDLAPVRREVVPVSAHPVSCRQCEGTGYIAGPTITETVEGRPHHYRTVKRCTHDWWRDDTGYNPELHDSLAPEDPRAVAARERGIAIGRAEREPPT